MFYEYDKIENHLKCPICVQKYVSPRILPCGKSICLNCIENISLLNVVKHTDSIDDAEEIRTIVIEKCPFCDKQHATSNETGFILNEFILQANEIKPEKVYRCQSYEILDNLITNLSTDLNELISKLQYPEIKIREHCDKIRNQIDLATETLLEKIAKFREKFIDEINLYEKDCSNSNNNHLDTKSRDFFQKIIKENEIKLNRFKSYVNRARIEEESVKNLINEAKLQEYKLKNQLKLINGKLFGKKMPHFEELASISKLVESSIIGRLNYESLVILNDLLDIEKIAQPKIEKQIEHTNNIDRALPLISNNNNNNTTLLDKDDKYLISCGNNLKIINDSHTLVEISFDYPPEFFATNERNAIFVQHFRNTWKNNRKEKAHTQTLSVYDYNLNLNYEYGSDYNILACVCDSQNIFVQTTSKYAINIYNWYLEKLTTIGQDQHADRAFYFKDFLLKLVKEDRVYMKKMKADESADFWIRVISLHSGELLNEYQLNSYHDHFFIDALSRTIVIDDIFSKISIFDKPTSSSSSSSTPNGSNQQAHLLYENKNLDFSNTNGLSTTLDGKVFFIKNKKKIQFYSFCCN